MSERLYLYRKEFANLHSCPVCGASRYKGKIGPEGVEECMEVTKGTPAKVAWYLPVIPRLKRLFANPKEAKMFRWHAEERKASDGKLRHQLMLFSGETSIGASLVHRGN